MGPVSLLCRCQGDKQTDKCFQITVKKLQLFNIIINEWVWLDSDTLTVGSESAKR